MERRQKLIEESLDAALKTSLIDLLNDKISVSNKNIFDTLYNCYVDASAISNSFAAVDISTELDLFFRQYFDALVKKEPSIDNIVSQESIVCKMLSLAIHLGIYLPEYSEARSFDGLNLLAHMQKIPFNLIDDLLASITIQKVEKIWNFIEILIYKLHKTSYFSKGQLLVLKTCNTVLKRLSKSINTEFCGRILMLLAAIYPISDRSALNIGGEVNTQNVSSYETEEEFIANSLLYGGKATAVSKSEDKMDIKASAAATAAVGEDGEEEEMTLNGEAPPYSLYKTFWGLQTYLCSALPRPDSTTNAMAMEGTTLRAFLIDVNIVLTAFDTIKLHEDITSGDRNISNDGEYMGSKYLTSSQLFSLQLRDRVLRVQVLTQILSYIKYLRCRSFEIKSIPAKDANILVKSLEEVERFARNLLSKVPPYGSKTEELVSTILHREGGWIRWKAIKPAPCPEFVRPRLPYLHDTKKEIASLKRKRETDAREVAYYYDYSDASIKAAIEKLALDVPSFEQHIEAFMDAEDPEAGIDDEYHPKHDSVYCWRAGRLLASKNIRLFEFMSDGKLARGLRIMVGKPPDTPPPSLQNDDDKMDEVATETPALVNEIPVVENGMNANGML